MEGLIPNWGELSTSRRAWEAVVLPIGWGVVCGLLLGVSAVLYLLGTLLGILGGVGAGAQHATRRDALLRALVGGTLFGLAILAGFELGGSDDAKVELPDPEIGLLAFTVLPAFPLHWLGWRLRQSRDGSA